MSICVLSHLVSFVLSSDWLVLSSANMACSCCQLLLLPLSFHAWLNNLHPPKLPRRKRFLNRQRCLPCGHLQGHADVGRAIWTFERQQYDPLDGQTALRKAIIWLYPPYSHDFNHVLQSALTTSLCQDRGVRGGRAKCQTLES